MTDVHLQTAVSKIKMDWSRLCFQAVSPHLHSNGPYRPVSNSPLIELHVSLMISAGIIMKNLEAFTISLHATARPNLYNIIGLVRL